jgi:nitrogen regulatory protein P-II 1
MDAHDRVALLILCSDGVAPQVVEAIRQNARTGLAGDGMISVCEATEVVRIRTGERGDAAV